MPTALSRLVVAIRTFTMDAREPIEAEAEFMKALDEVLVLDAKQAASLGELQDRLNQPVRRAAADAGPSAGSPVRRSIVDRPAAEIPPPPPAALHVEGEKAEGEKAEDPNAQGQGAGEDADRTKLEADDRAAKEEVARLEDEARVSEAKEAAAAKQVAEKREAAAKAAAAKKASAKPRPKKPAKAPVDPDTTQP